MRVIKEGIGEMTFSERLVKARKEKGFTQSEVAEKLNISFLFAKTYAASFPLSSI